MCYVLKYKEKQGHDYHNSVRRLHIHTHTNVELMNEFSKVSGYKVNTQQKSVVFLIC